MTDDTKSASVDVTATTAYIAAATEAFKIAHTAAVSYPDRDPRYDAVLAVACDIRDKVVLAHRAIQTTKLAATAAEHAPTEAQRAEIAEAMLAYEHAPRPMAFIRLRDALRASGIIGGTDA